MKKFFACEYCGQTFTTEKDCCDHETEHLAQLEEWDTLVCLMVAYMSKYGGIDIIDEEADGTTMHLDAYWDFSDPNKIRT